jgi:hypothetical protein
MRPQRREDAAAQVTKSHGISVMRSRRSLSHSVDAKRRPASGGINITGTIVACMLRRAAAHGWLRAALWRHQEKQWARMWRAEAAALDEFRA